MEERIEDWLIDGVKHPLETLATIVVVALIAVVLQKIFSKVSWAYKREKFFKQLEMKLYSK